VTTTNRSHRSCFTVLITLAALSALPSGSAAAQTGATSISASQTMPKLWSWRSIGPRMGGRSIAVHGSVSRPLEYYFGATGGGAWKTTDGGTTWQPVTDGFLTSSSVGAIGVCAANPDVVYIGTGEGQWRAQMNTGDGAYASRDAGKTWKHIGLRSSSGQTAITRMRVHPTDCNLVYAAVLGDPYGPNPERGVFRSADGGATWTRVLFRSNVAGVSDLVMDPADPRTLYATVWDAVRPPWGGVTGTTGGIFKSTDGGDHWTEITRNPGLPKGRVGKMAIAVSGADRNRLYAVIEADPDSAGVFRSNDAGATWTRMNGDNALAHRAEYYVRVYADPKLVDRIYVLNRNVYRSDDGGKTYRTISTPHGDNQDMWIDPGNSNRIVEANDGGANVTVNAGQTWTNRDYPTAQIYHLTTTNDFPYLVCGAHQDNSSKCVPSDGNGDFWYLGPAGEQGYIAMHPTKTTLGYGGSQRGGLVRYDRATGQKQDVDIWPDMSDGERPNQLKERFQWTFPIVMSPQDPAVIYAGSQHVWKTRNGGVDWTKISPDLTRADPKTLVGSDMPINDHSGTDYYATIFTIALTKLDSNVIWTGSDDGRIHVTRDGGKSWTNVTPRGLPDFAKASLITTSPHSAGKAYLAAEKYKLQDVKPYIFKTEDYGATWTPIVTGIGAEDFVRAVRPDPVRPGLLFAGAEHAPYVSFDDGAHWQKISLGLPDVQVSDVDVKDNDLVISTFGRGMYILDDISPLREISTAALGERLHVYTPANAVRTTAQQPLGVDYRQTVRPGVNVANVHYSLAQPAQRVTIEIVNSAGQVVRTYVGTPDAKPKALIRNSLGHVINGPRWGSATPDPVVPTGAGLHRVSWDLRYPPATDFPGLRLRDSNVDGPMVLPGVYTVRVVADGARAERAFTVNRDPRITDVAAADLAAQEEFALATHHRLNDATSAVARIRDIKAQIADRLAQTQDGAIAAAARELARQVSVIEEEVYEVRVSAESDIKHFGPKLTNKLANVYAVSTSTDTRPTSQSQVVFGELSTKLGVQLERLDQVSRTQLVRVNDLLRRANLKPIVPAGPIM